MIYLPDCIKATMQCLETPAEKMSQEKRTYNIQAVSFTPGELVEEMRKHFEELHVEYEPDERQAIGEGGEEGGEGGGRREGRREGGEVVGCDVTKGQEDSLTDVQCVCVCVCVCVNVRGGVEQI